MGAGPAEPRVLLAWLMWCYDQGYTNPADRAILENWLGADPATLHPDDVVKQQALLGMADEILALLDCPHHGSARLPGHGRR
jgi:hypothetical protein